MLQILTILLKSKLRTRRFGSLGTFYIIVRLLNERSSSRKLDTMSIYSTEFSKLKLKSKVLKVEAIFKSASFLNSISVIC